MTPKHLSDVPNDRKAIAPYNFVQLPVKVVKAPLPYPQATYEDHTGYLTCTLTAESPLYIRCGHTSTEFEQGLESRQLPVFFYHPSNSQKPILPGSSLRGMLRTLVEIASFSRITQVSDAQKFFFRAVTESSYRDKLQPLKVGYLEYQRGTWRIRPAKPIGNHAFVWIRENLIPSNIQFTRMRNLTSYYPQQISGISFEDIQSEPKNRRPFAQQISQNSDEYAYSGTLVTTGNMLETGGDPNNLKRKNHCLVGVSDLDVTPGTIRTINKEAIESYCTALTAFQKAHPPFDEELGALQEGQCLFYKDPGADREVILFGHCPNFRIPYQLEGRVKASTALDFLPEKLRESHVYDLATVLFGFVRSEKVNDDPLPALKGRVSITDAVCKTNGDPWYKEQPIPPQILEAPKPSTFQHYLVQSTAEKSELKHYGSQPGSETVIRGHKLYWHKGKQLDIEHPRPEDVPEVYKTTIKPVRSGVQFEFTIHFENLSDEELGALLWVLNLAQDDRYRLSLGMGKPLGMGAVKITHQLMLSQRKQRYKKLFEAGSWALAESLSEETGTYTQAFEKLILDEIDPDRKSFQKLEDVRRVKMLLAMLTWEDKPDPEFLEQTRYMEIERDASKPFIGKKVKEADTTVNEYRLRPVLPTPLQVKGLEGNNARTTGDGGTGGSGSGGVNPLKRGDRPSLSHESGSAKTAKPAPIKKRKS